VLLRMVVGIRMSIIGNIMSVESIDDNVGYIWTRYSNILISNRYVRMTEHEINSLINTSQDI
jgi:hypothetical protein